MSELEARAAAVFLAATDLPPDERAGLVERECAGDEDLRRRVEELLALERDVPTAFLDGAVPPATSYLAPGSTFAGFRILRCIGEGGMGTVYAARQSMPRREVALKVIRPGRMSSQALRRFRHEVEVLGNLQHPGIAQIHEAGTGEATGPDGERVEQPYLAMELVRGRPLLEYVRANELDVPARLELVARVCDAVHHAHQRAVIHRDLKPDNVLVTTEETTGAPVDSPGSAAGRPMILDFGIARVLGADAGLAVETRADELLGTLAYMSPEQLEGDRAAVDVRSDVYALGVMLYQVLVERLPFAFADEDLPGAIRRIRSEEPPQVGTLNPRLRGDVSTIVAKALARDPARRYQSALELAADLRCHVRGEPIHARSDSALYLLRRRLRRHRLLLGLAAAGLVVVGGFALVVANQARVNRALAEREAAARARADEDYGHALAALELLTEIGNERLVDVPQAGDARRELLTAVLDFHLDLLERHEGDQGQELRVASARLRAGRIRFDLGEFAEAREAARGITEGDPAAVEPEVLVGAFQLLGKCDRRSGDLESAERAFARGAEIAAQHVEAGAEWGRRHYATCLKFLSLVLSRSGEEERAVAALHDALEMLAPFAAEDADLVDRRVLADCRMQLGYSLTRLRRLDEAEEAFESSLELVLGFRAVDPESSGYSLDELSLLTNLGYVASAAGDQELAGERFGRSVELGEELVGEQPGVPVYLENLLLAHSNLARALAMSGEVPSAIEHMERAGELLARLGELVPDDPSLVGRRGIHEVNTGGMLVYEGRHAEALPWFEAAAASSSRALERFPGELDYRRLHRVACVNAGSSLLELDRASEALGWVARVDALTDEAELGRTLEILSRSITALEGDATFDEEARAELVAEAARVGSEIWAGSIALGLTPPAELLGEPRFAALVAQPSFEPHRRAAAGTPQPSSPP